MPEQPAARPQQSMLSEIENDVHHAFQAVRAQRLGAESRKEGSREGHDPGTRHANRDAFLIIENQRRALEVRVRGAHRSRRDRYRDLILITQLVGLEYAHLVGRSGRAIGPASLAEASPALDKDTPADWAQPWGAGAMYELRAAFLHYSQQRDRIRKRLSASVRAEAVAEAKRELDGIRGSSRLSSVATGWDIETESEPEPEERKPEPRAVKAEAEGGAAAKPRVRRRAPKLEVSLPKLRPPKPRIGRAFVSAAAIGASALAIVGAYAALRGGGGSDASSRSVSARVSERPVPVLVDNPSKAELAKARAQRRAERRRERIAAARARRNARQSEQEAVPVSDEPSTSDEPFITPEPVAPAPSPPSTATKPAPSKPSPPKPSPPQSSGPQPAPAPAPAPAPLPDSVPAG